MLSHLNISGLAVIDSLSIEFSEGFNVITGETGAGKSILIKALTMLLGGKVNSQIIRSGCSKASVTGEFLLPKNHPATNELKKLGLLDAEQQEFYSLLVRRQITDKSKNSSWINDEPVTLSTLKSIGHLLIDIFAQHENHRLLNAKEHIHYVDQFLKSKNLFKEYLTRFENLEELRLELFEKVESYNLKIRDKDYMQFRVDELSDFDPSCDDYEYLKERLDSTRKNEIVQEHLGIVSNILDAGYNNAPLQRAVGDVFDALEKLCSEGLDLKDYCTQLEEFKTLLDDISYIAGKKASENEIAEVDLESSSARISKYHELMRKLGVKDIDSLIQAYDEISENLNSLVNDELVIVALLSNIEKELDGLEAVADKLSEERKTASKKVCEKVIAELKDLNMNDANLKVEFLPARRLVSEIDFAHFNEKIIDQWQRVFARLNVLSKCGMESAQFLLRSNAGEQHYPLQKIASGGEISRIMLALKKSLSVGAETCVLVFDEIDTGISGLAADVVGRKMFEISEKFQTICISHLPQVACYADNHFVVKKFVKDKRTESTIESLDEQQSLSEIARLLSGDQVTTSSLANARELVNKARPTNDRN